MNYLTTAVIWSPRNWVGKIKSPIKRIRFTILIEKNRFFLIQVWHQAEIKNLCLYYCNTFKVPIISFDPWIILKESRSPSHIFVRDFTMRRLILWWVTLIFPIYRNYFSLPNSSGFQESGNVFLENVFRLNSAAIIFLKVTDWYNSIFVKLTLMVWFLLINEWAFYIAFLTMNTFSGYEGLTVPDHLLDAWGAMVLWNHISESTPPPKPNTTFYPGLT